MPKLEGWSVHPNRPKTHRRPSPDLRKGVTVQEGTFFSNRKRPGGQRKTDVRRLMGDVYLFWRVLQHSGTQKNIPSEMYSLSLYIWGVILYGYLG